MGTPKPQLEPLPTFDESSNQRAKTTQNFLRSVERTQLSVWQSAGSERCIAVLLLWLSGEAWDSSKRLWTWTCVFTILVSHHCSRTLLTNDNTRTG